MLELKFRTLPCCRNVDLGKEEVDVFVGVGRNTLSVVEVRDATRQRVEVLHGLVHREL